MMAYGLWTRKIEWYKIYQPSLYREIEDQKAEIFFPVREKKVGLGVRNYTLYPLTLVPGELLQFERFFDMIWV